MIVIRNGEQIKKGIGLSTWIMPGDQAITFPSQLNQVNFNALQVTSEMQGVEVAGMIIWSIYREEDGPFKCYKSFGVDLQQPVPKVANDKLQSMAVSIVRDRIANMTIDEILKNRQKLRDGVKSEIQKLLTGWGMWLETCEIQDVKISSGSLFKNL
jgi:regulator of protease activity HflC (stomatin/prohibitin superfamily)